MTRYTTDPVCMQSMASAQEPFLKKIIAHTKIVALQATALRLRDLHLTQYRSVATIFLLNLF